MAFEAALTFDRETGTLVKNKRKAQRAEFIFDIDRGRFN